MRSRASWFRAVLVLACVVFAGCSGDEDPAAQDESSTTVTSVADESSSTTEAPADQTSTSSTTSEPETESTPGVDGSKIRIGLSVDLSGPLSSVDSFVLDAQVAYFDKVNASGGIGGRSVEVVALDHASDIDAHTDNVQELLERSDRGVVMLSSVGGDAFASAVSSTLVEEGAFGISRGHVEPAGQTIRNVAHLGRSTCASAYDGVLRLIEAGAEADDAPTLAIVSRADAYGARSTVGANAAAEAADVDVVVNYRGPITAETVSDLAVSVAEASPDLVWVAVSPTELRELFLGLEEVDQNASWSGTFQSYDALLLETSVAAAVSRQYTHTAPIDVFDHDTNGRSGEIRSAFPDAEYWAADSLAFGWQQAELAHAALLAADAAGDLTRAGVTQAFADLADEATETSFFSVDAQSATLRLPLSDAGSTGLTPLEGLSAASPPIGEACG